MSPSDDVDVNNPTSIIHCDYKSTYVIESYDMMKPGNLAEISPTAVVWVFRHALSFRRALIPSWSPYTLTADVIPVKIHTLMLCNTIGRSILQYLVSILYIVITMRTTLITQICQLYISGLTRTTCKEHIYSASYSKCHLLFPTGYLNYEHIACMDILCHLILLIEV